MKKNILFILACLPLLAIAKPEPFTIKGKITSIKTTVQIYLRYKLGTSDVIDSLKSADGEFAFKGLVDGPVKALLMIDNTGKGLNQYHRTSKVLDIYLEKGNLEAGSADSLQHVLIKGSKVNEENYRFKALIQPYFSMQRTIRTKMNKLTKVQQQDTAMMNGLDREYMATIESVQKIIRTYIKENPKSFISLTGLMDIEVEVNPLTAGPMFDSLSPEVRNTQTGREFAASLALSRSVGVGRIAPGFTQLDTAGKAVSLSGFKGKYVLLDFWASWCGPCRAENPNVVKAFNGLKSKNFTVLSVSLDFEGRKEAWLTAIIKDGMPWTNISSLEGFNNPVAKEYNIQAIPQNFLIDPNGKIIGRNLKGEDLQEQISALMK